MIYSIKSLFLFFTVSCLITSCHHTTTPKDKIIQTVKVEYADGFIIEQYDKYTLVTVRNPWDSTLFLQKYILVNKDKQLPSPMPQGTLVRTPIERVACLYSLHVGILEAMGKIQTIKAVAEPEYISNTYINNKLKDGTIEDLNLATAVDVERLMKAAPELIFASPFQGMGYGNLEKCGIPIAEDAGYMETTPLGRAEWIKFTAVFYEQLAEADSIFKGIADRYNTIKGLAQKTIERPSIFSEKKYGQVWYVPGGASYMSCLFTDAGYNYCWKDTYQKGSIPLSQEVVYEKAENADFWLIKGGSKDKNITYRSLASENQLYTHFKAWKERKIIYSNTVTNHYFDKGVLEPDVVLSDFIYWAHPDILTNYTPVYFKNMSDEE